MANTKHRTEDRAPYLAPEISYSIASRRTDENMVRAERGGSKRDIMLLYIVHDQAYKVNNRSRCMGVLGGVLRPSLSAGAGNC